MRVLEPSAGTGRLLEALPGIVPFGLVRQTALQVVAVEVNPVLAAHLACGGLAGVVRCADFLTCRADVEDLGLFDVVLMNPPFGQGADIEHITHALTMLKPGGRLVALCANGPRQNTRLRPMVDACGGSWEDLPADSFKDEGTGVRVALITMQV
jgi:predicted RNA methylase